MIPWMLMAQRVQPPQGDDPKPRLDPVEVEKQSWVKGSSSDTTLSATVDAKSQIADQLSLHAALTSRTLVRIGPATNDEVAELIESMSDHRDRCLPRRGDPPSFATDTRSGRRSLYVNEGYRCSGGQCSWRNPGSHALEGYSIPSSRMGTCRDLHALPYATRCSENGIMGIIMYPS